MEIIWLTEKVVDPETDVITHIDWTARAKEGLFETVQTGRAELPAPDPQLVVEYLKRPTPEQVKRGITWDDLQDPPGFMRSSWIERDTLHPWLFQISDRDAIEAELTAQIRERQTPPPETPPLGYADEAEPEPEPEPPPYTPNFTIIPEQLAKYAEADEDVSAFRNRLKSYWQRFGIEDGMNFPGGGEPLTGEEKIQMRDIDMLLNSEEGRNARLHDWLFAD